VTLSVFALMLLADTAPNTPLSAKMDWPSPQAVQGVDVIENLNERIPMDAPFTNHEGKQVTLRELIRGDLPVVITPVYYECPTLCSVVLRGVVGALKATGLRLGEDYRVVTFSIDPNETAGMANEKRLELIHALGYPSGRTGWDFLVGDEKSISPLTQALGFKYKYDNDLKQYAHAATFMVLTPDGRISRYLYGVQYPPRDVRLALVEASGGKVGTAFDRIVLTCYRFDPGQRKYMFYVQGLIKGGGLLVFFSLATLLFFMWRREYRNKKSATAGVT
jgi:protein SCO1/2